MDNAPYYDQINAYLKGALSPENRAAFEQALLTDADLAAELNFQRSLKAAAEHRAAQAQAKDIMAHLRSKGLFESGAQQAERDRQLLESAKGDPEAIARLLAKHSSLADWKALDPEGFKEVVKERQKEEAPVLVMDRARVVSIWVRRVAAVAAVVVLGLVGYRYIIIPKDTNRIVREAYANAKPALEGKPPSELVSAASFDPEEVLAQFQAGQLKDAKRGLSGCEQTDCRYLLGHIYLIEAKYDSAFFYFDKIYSDPGYQGTFLQEFDEVDLHFYSALALLGKNDLKQAKNALQKIISDNYNSPLTEKAKILLNKISKQ